MIRFLDWFRPEPRRARMRFESYATPRRRDGETPRAFRLRMVDVVLARSCGEVFDHTVEDEGQVAA